MDINQKQKERLEQQFAFIREIDKEKFIGRQTYLTDGERKENDAEHAWHMAIDGASGGSIPMSRSMC